MEWVGEGIVLSSERFGEADALLEVMSDGYGRHRGFVKGGAGKRLKPVLQPGNRLNVRWRSRIEANLGRFTVEPVHSPLGVILLSGEKLKAMSAMLSVVSASLPERENHPAVYEALLAMIQYLEDSEEDLAGWAAALVRLEMGILRDLGYRLDLGACAATGTTENLVYVSPKTGRAVCAEAGAPYANKLLALPVFLRAGGKGDTGPEAVLSGLRLTGYFLDRHIWQVHHRKAPQARERLLSALVARVKKN